MPARDANINDQHLELNLFELNRVKSSVFPHQVVENVSTSGGGLDPRQQVPARDSPGG